MSAVETVASELQRTQGALSLQALELLEDGIWVCDAEGTPLYRNAAAAAMEARVWTHARLVGSIEEVVFNEANLEQLRARGQCSFEYQLGSVGDATGESVSVVALDMRVLSDADGECTGLAFHARDVSREWRREQTLQDRNIELVEAYSRLKQTQAQLLQSEKMASIGQLAAGVAHEINNPIGYVHSNLGTLSTYVRGLFSMIDTYDRLWQALPAELRALSGPVDVIKRQIDYDFLLQDLPHLLSESREGIERVKKIIMDLRDFSREGRDDTGEWTMADVRRGLESTLNIVRSELKYKANIVLSFADLPMIECIPSQLNQVFLNLLINAGQAIKEHGQIAVRTSMTTDEVCVSIADDGVGIPSENLARIFDPFFTTKPVGSGTGLGLALSYGIVHKHHGRIEVASEPGLGTTFSVYLPLRQPAANAV